MNLFDCLACLFSLPCFHLYLLYARMLAVLSISLF
jgi:hypothetical protein